MRKCRTMSGDTWDIIAVREYGELGGEGLMSMLVEANSEHVETVVFPAGVELVLPEVSVPTSRMLPPWM